MIKKKDKTFVLIIWRTAIDPANDSRFLSQGQRGVLWHKAGSDRTAYSRPGIENLGIIS